MLAGCGDKQPISNSSQAEKDEIVIQEASKEEKKAFSNSTPENDTDVGLKGVKIDTAETELSEEQKKVIKYFDNDYFYISNDDGYEFLQRYPQVYEGAQVNLQGIVEKTLSYSGNEFRILLQLADTESFYSKWHWDSNETYQDYLNKRNNNLVVIEGTTASSRLIEGDFVNVYGRYNRVESVQVDTTSHTVPFISVHRADVIPNDAQILPDKFDIPFVKEVAKTIFGNNIEVREPIFGEDVPPAEELGTMYDLMNFCIVELENQSNAKFTKYRFGLSTGDIQDAKTGALAATPNFDIIREIEFASDFEHFFVFTYDTSLETLNLDYYDKELNKVWNREFEETTSAVYDYTKNNIYLVANNEMFIINTETGDDTYSPMYVGGKVDIRKLSDGILVVSKSKSDGVMKLNLDGSVKWKTNLVGDVAGIEEVQLLDENIVLSFALENKNTENAETHYLVLNSNDGSVIIDAVSKN